MDNLNPSEISQIIKERINNLESSTQESNEGTIVFLSDGIARIHGLSEVMYGELIEFEGGITGMALNLERDSVGVVIFGDYKKLAEGDTAKCTGKILEVPVGPELIGRVVDALGNPIDGKGPMDCSSTSPIEKVAPGVMTRKPVDQPVQIGLKAVDSMVPIGRGQRELIIGDRQTGKTAIALDAIINQKGTGVKCIYVAVGQKQSSIAAVVRKLEEFGAMEHTIVVAAGAADPAPMQFLAPYAGRYVAKNIVSAGLAEKCEIQVSYAIGIAEPTSISINTFGSNTIPEEEIAQLVADNFELKPKELIQMLDLKKPIYEKTAAYGHFGREDEDFSWESTDKADKIK